MRFSKFPELFLLAFSLLLASRINGSMCSSLRTLCSLHVAETDLMVMSVRVGVLVVLRDVLELFVADITVERSQCRCQFCFDVFASCESVLYPETPQARDRYLPQAD